MELTETVELMESSDYQDRFRAEYYQLETRASKLSNMIADLATGELSFEPKTPDWVFRQQLNAMIDYLNILGARAQIEGISLEKEE
jgi:hypothetical protein